MKRHGYIFLVFTVIQIVTSSCNNYSSVNSSMRFIEELTVRIKNQDYETVAGFYSSSFYKIRSREQWLEKLKGLQQTYGVLNSSEVISVSIINDNIFNEQIILECHFKYSNMVLKEIFTIKKESDDYKIINHVIEI